MFLFENTKIKGYLEYVLNNISDDNVEICFDSGHIHTHFDNDFNFEFYKKGYEIGEKLAKMFEED
jgi:hypothetical protein